MKITKQYLKQLISEELSNMGEAGEQQQVTLQATKEAAKHLQDSERVPNLPPDQLFALVREMAVVAERDYKALGEKPPKEKLQVANEILDILISTIGTLGPEFTELNLRSTSK